MRSRSEAARSKGETKQVPVVSPSAIVKCAACEEDSIASKCTRRADGALECPSCGAPVVYGAKVRVEEPPREPERKYCGECGSEWPLVNGRPHINCGHVRAERIADPRKARNYGPPAGLQTRSDKAREARDIEDAVIRDLVERAPAEVDAKKLLEQDKARLVRSAAEATRLGLTPQVAIAGNRVSVQWGKSTFPVAPYANFSVGEFYRSTELAEGDDPVAVARAMLAELRAIADHAFAEQRAWYEEKLETLSK